MGIPLATLRNSGIFRALSQEEKIGEHTLEDIAKNSRDGQSVAQCLVTQGVISAGELAEKVSEHFGFPLMDLTQFNFDYAQRNATQYLQASEGLEALVLSKRGNVLFVAVADPTDLNTLQQIKFRTRLQVEPIVVSYDALEILCSTASSKTKDDNLLADMDGEPVSTEAQADDDRISVDDAPIVRFVHRTLEEAISRGASDIHFEPYEKSYRVRFRIDGVLTQTSHPPVSAKAKIASRIKVMSKLNISETRLPQDGRMSIQSGNDSDKRIDFRVSTLPTLFGEKIVLRVLNSKSGILKLDKLGFSKSQVDCIQDSLQKPHGMILVTGPTGSGKTVSLYAFLDQLNNDEINISTAEDPAEINIPGINQVNINEKIGVTFSKTLRALLRQDPDVILVGEIRDFETADIAVKASQTGHLVLSTLHTNDAISTIIRMLNMGIEPYNVMASVNLVIAQRLVRKLCSCKQPHPHGRKALSEAGLLSEVDSEKSPTPFCAIGCDACHGTGYAGRTGIYEVMPVSEALKELILQHADVHEMQALIRQEGVISMRQSGLEKVLAGATTIEEVLAATKSN